MKVLSLLIFFIYTSTAFSVDCSQINNTLNIIDQINCIPIIQEGDASVDRYYQNHKGDKYTNISKCLESSNSKEFELVLIYEDDHNLEDMDFKIEGQQSNITVYPWDDNPQNQTLEMYQTKLFVNRVFGVYSPFTPPDLMIKISNRLSCRKSSNGDTMIGFEYDNIYSSGREIDHEIISVNLDNSPNTSVKINGFISNINKLFRNSFSQKDIYFNFGMIQKCLDEADCSCCGNFDESSARDIKELQLKLSSSIGAYNSKLNAIINKYQAKDCHSELSDPFNILYKTKRVSVHACIKRDENLIYNYELANKLIEAASDKSLAPELRQKLLAKAGALFSAHGYKKEGIDTLKMLIELSKETKAHDNELFYKAQLASAQNNYKSLRLIYPQISEQHPGKAYLKIVIDKINAVELLYKSYAMAESLIQTLIKYMQESLDEGSRFEIDELKALLRAWKHRLDSGEFDSTVDILNDIQSSSNINAKRALGFLKNIGPERSKEIEGDIYITQEDLDKYTYGSVYDPLRVILEIEDSVRKNKKFPLYTTFNNNYNYYDGPWYKTAHQLITYAAKDYHPELKDDANNLIENVFDSNLSKAVDFLKGVTDPIMLASFGLARVTTAKLLGAAFGVGAQGIKVTVAGIATESAGFVVYDKLLRDTLTSENIDWGAKDLGKSWGDLSLRFAFAHAMAAPISRFSGVMKETNILGKTVSGTTRKLNLAGAGIDVALKQFGLTSAFYLGGKVGHQIGLSDHSTTFADEALMLLQFQLGTKLAGQLIKPLGTSQIKKQKIVENSALIAEQITGSRENIHFELLATSLIKSASSNKESRRAQAEFIESLKNQNGELSSRQRENLAELLDRANVKQKLNEDIKPESEVALREVDLSKVHPEWTKIVKELEKCK